MVATRTALCGISRHGDELGAELKKGLRRTRKEALNGYEEHVLSVSEVVHRFGLGFSDGQAGIRMSRHIDD